MPMKGLRIGRKGEVALLKVVIPRQSRPELDSVLDVAKVEDDTAGLFRSTQQIES